MSTKHTPGPWLATRSGSKNRVASMDTGETIAAGATAEDGRLIAAAPDLLDALENLLAWDETDLSLTGGKAKDVVAALAAVDRATGRNRR